MWEAIKKMVIRPNIQKTNKVKTCTFRLSNDDMIILNNLAEQMNQSRSYIIRKILRSFFDEYGLQVENESEQ